MFKREERRKYIRLKAYHLVKYKSLASEQMHEAPVIGTARDIGAGGIRLKTDEFLPEASVIEVHINFPAVSTSIFALARVVRIKPIAKSKSYDVGLEFIQIDEAMRAAINEKIKQVFKRLHHK